MTNELLAQRLIGLYQKDIETREALAKTGALFEGYNSDMEAVHVQNARELEKIIDETGGWPHAGIVGEEASDAAWTIAQHAISLPDFQRKVLSLLKEKEMSDKIPAQQLARMEDRILSFEGKGQMYGTQFDWDENGILNPTPIDDPDNVDKRRAAIGLKPIAEATSDMREQAAAENQRPPKDAQKRKKEAENWAKQTGWRR